MHILLTNDDGIFAPGLAAMYEQLVKIGDVTVIAPSEIMSGASHCISLGPLKCEKVDVNGVFVGYSVAGTPADCVKLAVNKLIDTSAKPIDLVVAGINCGANVGIHVHYSGTVGAAMEAAFYNIPSIALSAAFDEDMDLRAAAGYGLEVVKKLLPLSNGDTINVNIPRLPAGKPRGIKVVPNSTNGYHEDYLTQKNDQGQTVYLYTSGDHRDGSNPLDTTALYDGFITVTALHFDITDYEKNRELQKKLSKEMD